MKREDLKVKIEEFKENPDELIDYVMKKNGDDINALNQKIAGFEEQAKTYDKFKDYDELLQFKNDTLANIDKNQKIEWLKSQGAKHPDLLIDKLDFKDAKYDSEKKTYSGLEDSIKKLKTNYEDLFTSPQKIEKKDDIHQTSTEDFLKRFSEKYPSMSGK